MQPWDNLKSLLSPMIKMNAVRRMFAYRCKTEVKNKAMKQYALLNLRLVISRRNHNCAQVNYKRNDLSYAEVHGNSLLHRIK